MQGTAAISLCSILSLSFFLLVIHHLFSWLVVLYLGAVGTKQLPGI